MNRKALVVLLIQCAPVTKMLQFVGFNYPAFCFA